MRIHGFFFSRPFLSRSAASAGNCDVHGLFLCFFAGILCGALIGSYAPAGTFSVGPAVIGPFSLEAASFLRLVWSSAQYFVLLLLCSACWFGGLAAGLTLFLVSCRWSCSVSLLFALHRMAGLREAFFRFGVPALFIAPCFLLAAVLCERESARLFALRFHRSAPPVAPVSRRFLLLIPAAPLVAALYAVYLLPGLLLST